MTHRGRIIALGLLALAGPPSAAAAQDFTKIFTDIDRVSVFGRAGGFSPAGDLLVATNRGSFSRYGNAGVGIELGYNIRRHDDPATKNWFYEGGVGYTQIGGFRLDRDDVDLRGTIRELPTASFYGIRQAVGWLPMNPYYGISIGFAKLQNFNVYDADSTQFTATAETFTAGGSLGLARANAAFSPFVEVGYRLRDFRSLDYKSGGTVDVPRSAPRSLNLSGWHLDLGLQVGLNELKPKPKKTPPTPPCCTCTCTAPKP